MNRGEIDKPLFPLAFVGCWNREIRTTGGGRISGPREAVATAIEDIHPATIILGGDNIYAPTTRSADGKNVKGKIYDVSAFEHGANLYIEKAPTLLVAVGNHNIDKASFDIIETEQKRFGKEAMPAPYFIRKFTKDNINVIFINTNLVVEGREEAFSKMIKWLAGVTKEPYLLIQHEPISALAKIDKITGTTNVYKVLPRAGEILDILIRAPPKAILCADTHNYQRGELLYKGVSIPQYIVGTGGARPDPLIAVEAPLDISSADVSGLVYRFHEHTPGYGFLLVTGDADAQTYEFKGVSHLWQGGARRRTRRRDHRASRHRRTKSRYRVRG